MTYYKLFTHDRRSPLQGGEPVWDGSYPYELPPVTLDTGLEECAPGWHFVTNLAAGFRIAGLWPTGYPSLVVLAEPGPDCVVRGGKVRASTGTLIRLATSAEILEGIKELSGPFGAHRDVMAAEQIAWREALARPDCDPAAVEAGLHAALEIRGLSTWTLRLYPSAWDAWEAWEAREARAAWEAWAAREARSARATRDAWEAWEARAAWEAREAWADRATWGAREALLTCYAALQEWILVRSDLLTVGIRDAYRAGLAVAVPVAPAVLGWAMVTD